MNDRPTRPPLIKEDQIKLLEMRRNSQQYSYDLVQRLTLFVISIELIFCGYILLNSEKLGAVKFSSLLFLLAGCAAIFGIIWRFFYNQTYHDAVHGKTAKIRKYLAKLQIISYCIYILLTAIFLVSTILAGYCHLRNIEKNAANKNLHVEELTEPPKESGDIEKRSKATVVKQKQNPQQISINKNTETQNKRITDKEP
ncbi:MAG TPA: hypothetical protein ENN18_11270 [Proteobacteria bacterium]|nr:hypothetical protein [Pseudomonadota bacterium]